MKIATVILPTGQTREVQPANGKKFTLDELQGYVDGYIQIVKTKSPVRDMYINEEGKINNLPLNWKATALYQYGEHDPICGTVIVMAPRTSKRNDSEKAK